LREHVRAEKIRESQRIGYMKGDPSGRVNRFHRVNPSYQEWVGAPWSTGGKDEDGCAWAETPRTIPKKKNLLGSS